MVAVIVWMVGRERLVVPPPLVGCAVQPVQPFSARLPAIPDFEHFAVNDLNPFVPWEERERQRDRAPPAGAGRAGPGAPGVPTPAPVPFDPRRKSEGGGAGPRLRALYAAAGRQTTAVIEWRPSGARAELRPGQAYAGWTLVAIEHGSVAVLRDAQQQEWRLLAGDPGP